MGGRGSGGGKRAAGGGIAKNITAKSWSAAVEELKEKGFAVDAADLNRPDSADGRVTMYKNGDTYTAPVNHYSNGNYEVLMGKGYLRSETHSSSEKNPASAPAGTKLTHAGGWSYTKKANGKWATYHNGKRQSDRTDADIKRVYT